ncbi:MAG: hypothetical protein KGI38_08230 [Thaumarchaeota archaeon]|nr:hypothetical protein [Nitrososphaerota archaeon]
MAKNTLTVLVIDAVLLIALFYVVGDLQWRVTYATSAHSACPPPGCGYAPSFSYSLLTQFFTMAGNGVSLTSPPTLDWIQALSYALVAINAWFVYRWYRSSRPRVPSVDTSSA